MDDTQATASDHELAHDLAARAADLLVGLQEQGIASGQRGWLLEDIGDSAAHDMLDTAVSADRPDDGLLSEEGVDDGTRVSIRRSWIIDPLDGSSGFGAGNAEWAVHVALSIDGAAAVGAVAVPGMGITASTLLPPELPEFGTRRPIVVTGRSRNWSDGRLVAGALGADLAACSSAGVKAMLVARGEADVYVHNAPLYEWDVCAPAAVATAAGLHVSDCSGNPLLFNKAQPIVSSLLIARVELASDVISAVS